MKKIFFVISAATMFACNSGESGNSAISPNDTVQTVVTTSPADTVSAVGYIPAEGDVTRRNGKIQVWKNGTWVEANADQHLQDGVIVYMDGQVARNDREMELGEGEVVRKTGVFFDQAGKSIENAWDDTKRGVRKAGKAVGKAAKKMGDKIENAIDGDSSKY